MYICGKMYAIKDDRVVPVFGHTCLSGGQFVNKADRLNIDYLIYVDVERVETHEQIFVCYSNLGHKKSKEYAQEITTRLGNSILSCKNIFLTIAVAHPVVYIYGAAYSPDKIVDAIAASASSV